MPFTNLENRHFDDGLKQSINETLQVLETKLADKIANLSAEERQKYGSVNEQNKLVISKVKDFNDSQPTLSSPDIDWAEFNNDFDSRSFLQKTIQRLQGLLNGLENAKILHDYDNYQAALTEYDYTKYKASTQANGFQPKVEELAQFFSGRPSGSAAKNTSEPT